MTSTRTIDQPVTLQHHGGELLTGLSCTLLHGS
jgi:hypothetical protein